MPGDGTLVVPVAEAGVATDVAIRDDLVAFGDSPIVTVADDDGALYLATTRASSRFQFSADELPSPPALDTDPWSSRSLAVRTDTAAVVVWADDASPGDLRVVAHGLRVDADTLRPADPSLEVTGRLPGGWPGPGRATTVWAGTVPFVTVPVEPAEQHVLWALMEAVEPDPDSSPIEGFALADYPRLRTATDRWFGTVSSVLTALVVSGAPGIAVLAPVDIARTDVDLDALVDDLELIGPDELETRVQDLHTVLVRRTSDRAASDLDVPVRWEGDVHGVHRLLVSVDDAIGYDRVQRPGPAVCIVDVDVLPELGPATASTCAADRSPALTASVIDTSVLGPNVPRAYYDVWGVADDVVSRIDIVVNGEAIAAPLTRAADGQWFFQVELGERAGLTAVTAYALDGSVIDQVVPGPAGELPGFVEHPWR